MSENGSSPSRRSSSQNSHASADSRKAKTVRGSKQSGSRTPSVLSNKEDPALTSFPSFSPEMNNGQPHVENESSPMPMRSLSQTLRDRRATLAGLTSASPALNRHNALFDDSPRSSSDIPGSLHLASDEHIQRLIARTGAVKLVRQYAQDLALRDSEISTLRIRADNRERELKRLLREANVGSADVEKRLLRLEQSPIPEQPHDEADARLAAVSLDGMMNEAMADDLSESTSTQPAGLGLLGHSTDFISNLQNNNIPSRGRETSLSDQQAKDSTYTSRSESRANSVTSARSQDLDATVRPRVPSANANRSSGLYSLFQPPSQSSSYFIGGSKLPSKKPKAGDEVSVKSTQSSRSLGTWTQLFGGKPQNGRARASSTGQKGQGKSNPSQAESALAKLSKQQSQPSPPMSRSSTSLVSANAAKSRPTGRRTPTATRLSTSPGHIRNDSNASSLPPTVELDSMIETSKLPPTMSGQNNNPSGLLTDRFGFIYDQRRRKRRNWDVQKQKRNRLSTAEPVSSPRVFEFTNTDRPEDRPDTPMSVDEDVPKKSWQDYLKIPTNLNLSRPTELLSHTPSAGGIMTVNSADISESITPPNARKTISISALDHKPLPSSSSITEPQSTTVTATSLGFVHENEEGTSSESESLKVLLEQLNDLHDSLQAEKTVKWNDFLRRVRAERANNPDRTGNNAPEAELLNGELIGVASLNRAANTKGKYTHFKSLVLAGIPVSLRPKIWAECSGASSLRIPGYYEDLVYRAEEGGEIDEEIANQIKADVRRTLTDNIFFRQGPGVYRLEEVLRAYSLHNSRLGYTQGLNILTGSLLLICATAEECFWILVALVDHILPGGYYDNDLIVARADQIVLRQYVTEVLPKLDAKLEELGVVLEACTFHWFLSLYAGVLTGGEALYRVWDPIICLPSTTGTTTAISESEDENAHNGTGSPFLFQFGLALLKLNEPAIVELESAAQVYSYINHNMTDHVISLDALVQASDALRTRVKMAEVLERRKAALKELGA